MEKSLFFVETGLNPEYKPLLDDLLKFATFLVVQQILSSYVLGRTALTTNFLVISLLFTLIGLAVYHLIVKKLINLS